MTERMVLNAIDSLEQTAMDKMRGIKSCHMVKINDLIIENAALKIEIRLLKYDIRQLKREAGGRESDWKEDEDVEPD